MNNGERKDFLSQVDSIQRRFMESLITGKRDPIFQEKIKPAPESGGKDCDVRIDSQRGTLDRIQDQD